MALKVKNAHNAGDPGFIPGSGRSPEEGNGYPHQCSCLEDCTDRGVWQAAVHEVAESDRTEPLIHKGSLYSNDRYPLICSIFFPFVIF